jgi:hypothetical protein
MWFLLRRELVKLTRTKRGISSLQISNRLIVHLFYFGDIYGEHRFIPLAGSTNYVSKSIQHTKDLIRFGN